LSAAILEELELIWVCCGWRTPPTTHSAVLGSWWWAVCRPKRVELHIKYEIKILIHCCILLDFLCELYYDARIHKHQVQEVYFTMMWKKKCASLISYASIKISDHNDVDSNF
jgi:hypothetical protein